MSRIRPLIVVLLVLGVVVANAKPMKLRTKRVKVGKSIFGTCCFGKNLPCTHREPRQWMKMFWKKIYFYLSPNFKFASVLVFCRFWCSKWRIWGPVSQWRVRHAKPWKPDHHEMIPRLKYLACIHVTTMMNFFWYFRWPRSCTATCPSGTPTVNR